MKVGITRVPLSIKIHEQLAINEVFRNSGKMLMLLKRDEICSLNLSLSLSL